MATKVRSRKTRPTKALRRKINARKQLAIDAIRKLPDDATYEQMAEELAVLNSIQKGMEHIEAGRFITHEELKRQIKQWFSK